MHWIYIFHLMFKGASAWLSASCVWWGLSVCGALMRGLFIAFSLSLNALFSS